MQHGRLVLGQQPDLKLFKLLGAAPEADRRFADPDREDDPHEILDRQRIDRTAPVEKYVSNSLKELLGWKLVRRVPVRGDRRDHYEAETDPWEIARRIAEGRKAREIDPALVALQACVEAARDGPAVSDVARQRLADMASFVESLDTWYGQMLTLSNATLLALIRMGARVIRVLGRSQR